VHQAPEISGVTVRVLRSKTDRTTLPFEYPIQRIPPGSLRIFVLRDLIDLRLDLLEVQLPSCALQANEQSR
jgi:hypothetical protein